MSSLRKRFRRIREKSRSNEYNAVISQWKKEISDANKKNDWQRQLRFTFLLAESYISLKLYSTAIDYCKKGIGIAKAVGDKAGELKACYLLAKIYDERKKYNEDAIYYSEKCIELADEINEKTYYLKACYLLVKTYGLRNQYGSAIVYAKKYLHCAQKSNDKESELKAYRLLMAAYDLLQQYDANTVFYCQKCLDITEKTGDVKLKQKSSMLLIKAYAYLQQFDEVTISYCKKCLDIFERTGNTHNKLTACYLIAKACGSLGLYSDAIPYIKRYIGVAEGISDKHAEMTGNHLLALAYDAIGKHEDAVTCGKKSFDIAKETGNQLYKMKSSLQIAKACFSKKQYNEAVIYAIECNDLAKQHGDDSHELDASLLLSNVYFLTNQYKEVIDFANKCVDLANKANDQRRLTVAYLLLGKVYYSQSRYHEAIARCRKCILMEKFVSMQDEMDAYSILVKSHYNLQEYDAAISRGESCIRRAHEVSHQHALTDVYYFVGKALYSSNRCDDAITHCRNCIDTAKQNGDKSREMEGHLLLAVVFYDHKRYSDAIIQCSECIDNARQEGDKLCEMEAHLLAARCHLDLECYEESSRSVKKCISMAQETGHLKLELTACIFNASLCLSTGKITDLSTAIAQGLILADELADIPAKQCLTEVTFKFLDNENVQSLEAENFETQAYQGHESLVNMGRETETAKKIEKLFVLQKAYLNQVSQHHFAQAIDTLKQIAEIGPSSMTIFLESFCHHKMGRLYLEIQQMKEAVKHLNTAIDRAKKLCSALIENVIVFKCSRMLGVEYFKKGEIETSIGYLRESISCIDFFVKKMEADEHTIIDFIDNVNDCYNYLAKGLIKKRQITEALLVLEQRNARALKEQLLTRHGMKEQDSNEEHLTYRDIESLVSKHRFSILFCSILPDCLYTFLVESGSDVQFRQYPAPKEDFERSIELMRENFIINNNRTLPDTEGSTIDQDLSKTVGRILAYFGSASRPRATKEPCENVDVDSITNDLEVLYYKLFGEMTNSEDEIVIIPDGSLYKVPFAALRNPNTDQYLSQTKRVRIAPSITTLKLLQKLPVSKSTNPALVIGNPLVGEVMLDGKRKKVRPLSAAFREANAVSSICKVTPLTGQLATKPAVIEELRREVSLVHIAAHGCFANGTIALAPPPETKATKPIPDEEDYLLTMADVQQIQVLALLVVLSSCLSGLGEIKAEGVVGMSRAFLAQGARAVVASRWAVDDRATQSFMEKFYQHLEAGESASMSLHRTMEEMRQHELYSDPKYWAPFFLMGADVTINF